MDRCGTQKNADHVPHVTFRCLCGPWGQRGPLSACVCCTPPRAPHSTSGWVRCRGTPTQMP
eukprot:348174-Karenia_brevis.AAC.1